MEGTYSQDKRRFGSQLRATSVKGQWGDLMMKVLIHNTALLLRPERIELHQRPATAVFNRAGCGGLDVVSQARQ